MDLEFKSIKNILLVEDDLRDIEMTMAALEEYHLANKVFVVHNGAEALDYLFYRGIFKTRENGNPIFVLLDNKMPKVNGMEVLKAMKADEHLKMIPVVVLTSSREAPDVTEFYKQGVNAYVVKPMDFSEFMKVVKQLGFFWAAVNESPPNIQRKETSVANGEVVSPEKIGIKNENTAPHPASRG
jgi:CheY-like chemotaxis protein